MYAREALCVYFVLARYVQPKTLQRHYMFVNPRYQIIPGDRMKAFTLIEMVTVIAILVILMTSGLSLLNGSGSQSRKAGTDMMSGLIEQARTIAITTRTDVVLAIAEPGDIAGGDERCRLGLFRLRKPVSGAPTPTTDKYDMIARWQFLNTGIVLLGDKVDGVRNPLDEQQVNIVYGPSIKEITLNAHIIKINSRGKLILPEGSDPIVFRIAEGGYRGGKAKANIRSGSARVSENVLKVGRVTARPYRID
jgi:prepilin-type N-terminal cleavage/methylation domain-containing protein